jgi:hypothetical protein
MFVVLNILKGGETRSNTCGYFYAIKFTIQRFCTPVWSVNAPTALEVLSNGKGRTVFHFCPQTNISEMLNTEKRCLNGENTPKSNTPTERNTVTIEAFNVEKNAKNRSYAFTLNYNLLNAFIKFCKATAHVQDPHSLCLTLLTEKV